MTLRLPRELDSALEEMARERHLSKHALIVEAAERFVRQQSKTERVISAVDEITVEYAELLKRLEEA